MRWHDVSIDGEWDVPQGKREKGVGGSLILPEIAIKIIRSRPRFASNPYVFAGRGGSHLSGYSKAKAQLDAKAPLPEWRLHDLRRTARSLMSRAGVRPDIAERVLGHAIKGVEATYDRHAYRSEKADALKCLAGLIETILHPVENVVHITQGPLGHVASVGQLTLMFCCSGSSAHGYIAPVVTDLPRRVFLNPF